MPTLESNLLFQNPDFDVGEVAPLRSRSVRVTLPILVAVTSSAFTLFVVLFTLTVTGWSRESRVTAIPFNGETFTSTVSLQKQDLVTTPTSNHDFAATVNTRTLTLNNCLALGNEIRVCYHVNESVFLLFDDNKKCFHYDSRDNTLKLFEIYEKCVLGFSNPQTFFPCSKRSQVQGDDQLHLRYLVWTPFLHAFYFQVEAEELTVHSSFTVVNMTCTLSLNQTKNLFEFMVDIIY